MSILVNKNTKVLTQGITGATGQLHTRACREYGTQMVAGVTPGRGGTDFEGIPIFDTVEQAVKTTGANASVIYVPPPFAADAILEAADAAIPLAVCITGQFNCTRLAIPLLAFAGDALAWGLQTHLFFAQHVLRLEEEPDDEEVMDPRRQGQLVHQVFESFFREWQGAGHKAITAGNLDLARDVFRGVVDRALERLPDGEAALERTRLLGSSAASGLGEAVFRMEAERPVPVVDRLLEHALKGSFTIATKDGPRVVELRGKADRVDLLADGTFRLIDYKLGWPPDRGRALQLPVYSICAEQRLDGYGGRSSWTTGEAVYLAFKGPKRVVPLFASPESRLEILARAQQRLADTIDAISRGEFPPTPDDVYRCEMCSFAAVCRKDYVGDV